MAGAAIAYVPFLTVLLPVRITDMAGASDVQWLAYVTFAGAIAASLGNILFGWLSDITRNRRLWVLAGLVLSNLLLVSFSLVERFETLIALILIWQLSLNMMLGPLGAWAGDCVPDHQKGLLGGLLAFSPAMGALSGALITLPGLASPDLRLWMVSFLVCACILPVLVFGRPAKFPELQAAAPAQEKSDAESRRSRHLVVRMWLARLLVQISEAALFAYLYFWFRSVDPAMRVSTTAQILSLVLIAAIPVALITGRWADRQNRPISPLAACAALSSVGLVAMALSSSLTSAIAGYVLFGLASVVFLSLHTGQTLRVLPEPQRRGRDLGLFNLTNTGPSLVMPWMVLALVPVFGFPILLALLACLTMAACVLLLTHSDLR
jgi:MFS family permease